jgi:hypothetical protein
MIERKREPTFKCDQYRLPRLKPGIKQPVWVHNKRKFPQSLTFHPFVEFNLYKYILVYNNYPNQIQNYPHIAQNFQHIIPNQGARDIPKTPPLSPTSSSS